MGRGKGKEGIKSPLRSAMRAIGMSGIIRRKSAQRMVVTCMYAPVLNLAAEKMLGSSKAVLSKQVYARRCVPACLLFPSFFFPPRRRTCAPLHREPCLFAHTSPLANLRNFDTPRLPFSPRSVPAYVAAIGWNRHGTVMINAGKETASMSIRWRARD